MHSTESKIRSTAVLFQFTLYELDMVIGTCVHSTESKIRSTAVLFQFTLYELDMV